MATEAYRNWRGLFVNIMCTWLNRLHVLNRILERKLLWFCPTDFFLCLSLEYGEDWSLSHSRMNRLHWVVSFLNDIVIEICRRWDISVATVVADRWLCWRWCQLLWGTTRRENLLISRWFEVARLLNYLFIRRTLGRRCTLYRIIAWVHL